MIWLQLRKLTLFSWLALVPLAASGCPGDDSNNAPSNEAPPAIMPGNKVITDNTPKSEFKPVD